VLLLTLSASMASLKPGLVDSVCLVIRMCMKAVGLRAAVGSLKILALGRNFQPRASTCKGEAGVPHQTGQRLQQCTLLVVRIVLSSITCTLQCGGGGGGGGPISHWRHCALLLLCAKRFICLHAIK